MKKLYTLRRARKNIHLHYFIHVLLILSSRQWLENLQDSPENFIGYFFGNYDKFYTSIYFRNFNDKPLESCHGNFITNHIENISCIFVFIISAISLSIPFRNISAISSKNLSLMPLKIPCRRNHKYILWAPAAVPMNYLDKN